MGRATRRVHSEADARSIEFESTTCLLIKSLWDLTPDGCQLFELNIEPTCVLRTLDALNIGFDIATRIKNIKMKVCSLKLYYIKSKGGCILVCRVE